MHIGIIPDGNRRYGKKHKLGFSSAYKKGKDRLKDILNYILDSEEINEITVYALSYKNCVNRSKTEVNIAENIIIEGFDELLIDKRIKEVLVTFHGNIITDKVISDKLQEKILELRHKTDSPKKWSKIEKLLIKKIPLQEAIFEGYKKKINFLIAYDEKHYAPYGYSIFPIDFIIRTGGYKRLSGFCPVESANAELFFVNKLFPEFSIENLKEIIEEFKEIERNFGR